MKVRFRNKEEQKVGRQLTQNRKLKIEEEGVKKEKNTLRSRIKKIFGKETKDRRRDMRSSEEKRTKKIKKKDQ